jgi:hypothetical protein
VQVVTILQARNCLRAQLQPKPATAALAPGLPSSFSYVLVRVSCVTVPCSCSEHVVLTPVLLLAKGSLQHGRCAGPDAI